MRIPRKYKIGNLVGSDSNEEAIGIILGHEIHSCIIRNKTVKYYMYKIKWFIPKIGTTVEDSGDLMVVSK